MAATGGIIARMTFREDGKIINEDVQLGTYTADGDEIKVYYTIFDGLTPFVFTLEDDALVYEIGGEETRYERESGAGGDVVGTFVREDENGSTVRIAFESDGSASCTTVTPPNRAYSVEGGKLIITTSDQTIGGEADIVISGNTMTMTVLGKDMVFTRVSD